MIVELVLAPLVSLALATPPPSGGGSAPQITSATFSSITLDTPTSHTDARHGTEAPAKDVSPSARRKSAEEKLWLGALAAYPPSAYADWKTSREARKRGALEQHVLLRDVRGFPSDTKIAIGKAVTYGGAIIARKLLPRRWKYLSTVSLYSGSAFGAWAAWHNNRVLR